MRRSRHEDLENQLAKSAQWAITYGDFMSYLMIFFLIMFSFTLSKSGGKTTENVKYQESLIKIQKVFGGKGSSLDYDRLIKREKEESMVTQLKQALDKKDLSKYAKIETWDKKIRLILASAVLFDSGRATLAPRSEKILAAVAQQLKTLDNPIQIEGHTDNVPVRGGRYKSNWELSMARAYSVLVFLEKQGIAPQRLSAIGYGKYHPIADNNTAEGRAKNRRIEIDLLRTE